MQVDFQSIFGFQIGLEFADEFTKQEAGISWGLSIDLGIMRVVLSKGLEDAV